MSAQLVSRFAAWVIVETPYKDTDQFLVSEWEAEVDSARLRLDRWLSQHGGVGASISWNFGYGRTPARVVSCGIRMTTMALEDKAPGLAAR